MTKDTRLALLRSAEQHFLRGIEVPSFREITRDADQKNTSALQYHFKNRDELLKAVLARHDSGIDLQRHALLDQQDLDGASDPRGLAAVLVLPLAAKLSDPDGGLNYLQIMGEVVARPLRFNFAIVPSTPAASIDRWSAKVELIIPPETVGPPLHRRFAAISFAYAQLARLARERPAGDHRLFISHLVDVVLAVLCAPLSEQTQSLLRPSD
ncbi:MAG: hypothetical protein U5K30_13960 [Acidimicrobiales bacterium]|nr:hypothetical protein [Acidimicrobiales bacterium]